MKKFSLCKQLLLAGSVLIVAAACQCQKKPEMQQMAPCEQEDNSQSDDEENCSSAHQPAESAPAAGESIPAAKVVEPAEPSESVMDTMVPVSTPVSSAPVSEDKAEQPVVEAPKLEAVSAVSEHQITSFEPAEQE